MMHDTGASAIYRTGVNWSKAINIPLVYLILIVDLNDLNFKTPSFQQSKNTTNNLNERSILL